MPGGRVLESLDSSAQEGGGDATEGSEVLNQSDDLRQLRSLSKGFECGKDLQC